MALLTIAGDRAHKGTAATAATSSSVLAVNEGRAGITSHARLIPLSFM
jgi:hypothetical protein